MKLLDRYILQEYLRPVFFCLTGFCMLFVMWDLLGHISKFISSGASVTHIVCYYLYLIASSLTLLAPASLLLATLYCLWQMMRTNQITAMRACGISLPRVMLPLMAVGAAFSLAVGLINDTALSRYFAWSEDIRTVAAKNQETAQDIILNIAYYSKPTAREWIVDSFDRLHPNALNGIRITQFHSRTNMVKQFELTARRAEWLDSHWWLFDVSILPYGPRGIPMGKKPTPIAGSSLGTLYLELSETPTDFLREIKPWRNFSAMEMWQFLDNNRDISKMEKAEKRYDFHSRLAMPWACFVVTLFGVPMGARTSRQGIVKGMMLAIGMLLVFYLLSQIGLFLGKQKHIAPWIGAWLSNMVFLAVGIIMSYKMR